jgi:beta-1,4-mannooligosaccharide/beta-1,4-mannosyl-N-acetylglucosamine phosphorylase
MKDATGILQRHPENPIMHVKDYPGVAQIYNPSPIMHNGETILLVSVVPHKSDGFGQDMGETRIARSKDGVNFTMSEENFIEVGNEYPYNLMKHFIDNRTTKIDDVYYIVTPVMMNEFDAPIGLLGKTVDFKTYEKIAVITQPRNRGASLFPEKINGKYCKLDRPNGVPGLIHWGNFRPVMKGNYRFWNTRKIGPTPPIKTEKGWLEIIHGVRIQTGGDSYYVGAVLLDLENPEKVIGKTGSYLLAPEMDYETRGVDDNVVFPCGAIADYEKDELRLYYGAADTAIGLASGSLSEIVEACIDEI